MSLRHVQPPEFNLDNILAYFIVHRRVDDLVSASAQPFVTFHAITLLLASSQQQLLC
jgi:hypothetical protein